MRNPALAGRIIRVNLLRFLGLKQLVVTKISNPTEETEENQLPQLKKFSSLSLQIGRISLS